MEAIFWEIHKVIMLITEYVPAHPPFEDLRVDRLNNRQTHEIESDEDQ